MPFRPKSVLRVLLDIVELYIPMLAFFTVFACFILQIVSRYFFTPLMWPEELALLSFLWVALLGALYAKRSNSMVAFSMVYDVCSPRVQRAMRLVGNSLLVFALGITFVPSLEYVSFMSFRTSGVLEIPLSVAYSCYVIFLADIIIRYAFDIIVDLRGGTRGGKL